MKWNPFKKRKCNHERNVRHLKYHSKDGTPMIETTCFDCGWYDKGHVYTDDNDWRNEIIITRKGKTTIREPL